MKRKLIEFDVFENIRKNSLSNAEKELQESSQYLAKALNLEAIKLNCYGPESVVFESIDGTYVHANYSINNDGYIEFDNVQELIINEESEKAKSKEIIRNLLESIIESNEQKSNELFKEWMNVPSSKRIFTEVRKRRLVPIRKNGKATGKYRVAYWQDGSTPKRRQSAKVKLARAKGKKRANMKRSGSMKKLWAANRKRAKAGAGLKRMMKEWSVISENVLGYVDYQENGPIVNNLRIQRDDNGNVVSVKIPTNKIKNEAKMLQFNWKTLNTDLILKRNNSKKMHEDISFAKSVEEIRKQNALSDDKALEESLEKTASNWSDILYLTQSELSEQIKLALESIDSSNYDDSTCDFIAEGLLRTAYEIFTDKVAKVINLSRATVSENSEDRYSEFQNIVGDYYKKLDETTALEMQVFVDLYEALRTVHELAKEDENVDLAEEVSEYLDELMPIITRETEPCLEVAAEAAEWLYDLVETNLETSDWNVSDSSVVSATGDHPDLHKKARMSYSPANDLDPNKGSKASQGKGEDEGVTDELTDDGFSNLGGEGVYPNLDNPYLLGSKEYKIKGEKDIDSDSGHLAHWGSEETWPNLKNPYAKNTDVFDKEVK